MMPGPLPSTDTQHSGVAFAGRSAVSMSSSPRTDRENRLVQQALAGATESRERTERGHGSPARSRIWEKREVRNTKGAWPVRGVFLQRTRRRQRREHTRERGWGNERAGNEQFLSLRAASPPLDFSWAPVRCTFLSSTKTFCPSATPQLAAAGLTYICAGTRVTEFRDSNSTGTRLRSGVTLEE